MSDGILIAEDAWERVRAVVQWVEANRSKLLAVLDECGPTLPVMTKLTGSTGTSGTAVVSVYDGSTWSDLPDNVSLATMNGEYLKQGSYYPAIKIGDGVDFIASPGAIRVGSYYGVYRLSFTGSGFTVTETTAGQVSVSYTETNSIIVDTYGTQTLNTDNTTGIYSTNPGGGSTTTTLKCSAASVSAWGVVDTTSQSFAGAKTFQDGVYVKTSAGSSTLTHVTTEWVQLGGGAGMYLYGYYNNVPRPGITHAGTSYCSIGLTPPTNGTCTFDVSRGFWDGFASTLDSSYLIDMVLQGKYCVNYYSGGSWAQANGQTGTIGPGATCRGGIVVGTGSTGFTGTVP